MFQDRHWPEGFEFPSCVHCNNGTDDHDLLVAMLARMDPFENKGDKDGKQVGLMKLVNKQFPGLLQRMMPSAAEARRTNKELGIEPAPGQTHQETGVVNVPKEFHEAVCTLARKLAKGVFYNATGTCFPNDGCLLSNWFTNVNLLREGKYVIFEILKDLGGTVPDLVRSGKFLNDQFEYKFTLSPEKNIFIIQARFGNSFGLVILGCTLPGRLEAMIERLREQEKRDGPFVILQPV